ncbi:MAG: phage tail protein [Fusobacterium gastrosuis]|uniref:phage tail protein n=1 Tax=Fusobacterium gastrosuis TaxID=1755100 RepID=UPI002A8C601C|nr:phage tail protein [Fusobacterium gastrosuis]
MAKNINVLLAIKDQFTAPLKKATKSTKDMQRQLDKARNKVKAFTNSIKNSMKTVAKWGAIGLGALTAGAVAFAKGSVDIAKDQVRIEKILEENMKRTSKASSMQIQAIKDEASALQGLGVVGDEVALAGAAQLAVYGLKSEQIKKLMPNLNDMLAKEKGLNGTQEDSIAMADVIGKALAGKTKGLLKYGVQLTETEEKVFKTMKAEQRMNLISKKLTASIGGTNKALRETDEGKIVAAKNAWGDMREELGKKLLPYLGKFAEWFETKIPDIQNFILGIADKAEQLIIKAQPYIEQFKNLIGSIWEKAGPALQEFGNILLDGAEKAIGVAQGIIENWDKIGPSVYIIIGAFALYKATMFACAVWTNAVTLATKLKISYDKAQAATTGVLTIKQWAFNAALNANPIGVVIGLIAGAIAVGVLLYKNWDLVKNKVSELWKKLDNNPLGRLIKWFLKFGTPIGWIVRSVIYLYKNFDTLKAKSIELWEGLKANTLDLVTGAVDWFKIKINEAGNIVALVKDKFLEFCKYIETGFLKTLDMILHPIDTAKNAIGGLIDKLKFWNKEEVKDKNIKITETIEKNENKNNNGNNIKPPRHALGTSYFQGGITGINEGGRNETAILPSGTKILSHEEGKTFEEKSNIEKQVIIKEVENKKNSDKKIEVHIHISGNFIGEREHMEKYAEYTCKKVIAAVNNT